MGLLVNGIRAGSAIARATDLALEVGLARVALPLDGRRIGHVPVADDLLARHVVEAAALATYSMWRRPPMSNGCIIASLRAVELERLDADALAQLDVERRLALNQRVVEAASRCSRARRTGRCPSWRSASRSSGGSGRRRSRAGPGCRARAARRRAAPTWARTSSTVAVRRQRLAGRPSGAWSTLYGS